MQFPKGLEAIWGISNDTADLIIVGPVDNELHISTSECRLYDAEKQFIIFTKQFLCFWPR